MTRTDIINQYITERGKQELIERTEDYKKFDKNRAYYLNIKEKKIYNGTPA